MKLIVSLSLFLEETGSDESRTSSFDDYTQQIDTVIRADLHYSRYHGLRASLSLSPLDTLRNRSDRGVSARVFLLQQIVLEHGSST